MANIQPNRFTTKKREAYLEHLRRGALRGAAAKAVGVSRWTPLAHAKADPEFARAIEEAELAAVQVVEDALFAAAAEGNVTAQIFVLTNRAPDRWRDRRNVAPARLPENPIPVDPQIEALPDAVLADILRTIDRAVLAHSGKSPLPSR